MPKVVRPERGWIGRDIIPFFRDTPNIWNMLNAGQEVELTEEQIQQCKDYVLIKEETVDQILNIAIEPKAPPTPKIKQPIKKESQSREIDKEV